MRTWCSSCLDRSRTVGRVTIMKSARVGYTKILDHAVGYFIHQDPSPMLVVQPRVEDAEDYSSTEIEPMLRDTPVLREAVGDLKGKDAKQKLLKRVFRNGSSISFVGANSPGGFRRVTVRVVMFDEVDGYPALGAGDDGDQIRLGEEKLATVVSAVVPLITKLAAGGGLSSAIASVESFALEFAQSVYNDFKADVAKLVQPQAQAA